MRTRLTDLPDDPRHGTRSGYSYHGCRCEPCTAASTTYHQQRQRSAKAWADLKAWVASREGRGIKS